MKRILCLVLLAAPLLAACSDVRQVVGLGRNNPDEFMVVKNPPLAMPPEFELQPPDPTRRKPTQAQDANLLAATAVGADIVVEEVDSPGLSAFLTQAGAKDAQGDIRMTLDEENDGVVVKDPSVVDRLMFWKDQPVPDPTVDAPAEAERVDEVIEESGGFISGDGAKFEQEKPKAPLEGIF